MNDYRKEQLATLDAARENYENALKAYTASIDTDTREERRRKSAELRFLGETYRSYLYAYFNL